MGDRTRVLSLSQSARSQPTIYDIRWYETAKEKKDRKFPRWRPDQNLYFTTSSPPIFPRSRYGVMSMSAVDQPANKTGTPTVAYKSTLHLQNIRDLETLLLLTKEEEKKITLKVWNSKYISILQSLG